MPSRSESFGLVYLEAWLHKKPVIGCKIGPVMNLIDDKKNGMLVSFDNASELISALETLQNPLLRKQLGVDDNQWLKRMISHHSTALTTSKIISKKSKNDALIKLANDIIDTQEREIKLRKSLIVA